jgi:hypothetical protein
LQKLKRLSKIASSMLKKRAAASADKCGVFA